MTHPDVQSIPLKRGVDLLAIVALGLGTAVGVAVFSVEAPATALAGPGMLISVLIAAAPTFVIAVAYAFMGSAVPVAGASYEWPRRFVHPTLGFMVSWLRIAGNTAAMVVLAFVLVRYLSMAMPLPVKPAMFALFALILLPNLFGVAIAARLQVVLMGLLIVMFAVFTAWGAPSIALHRFTPLLPHGLAGVLGAVPLLIGLFFGIEAATEMGEEVKGGGLAIPIGIAVSIVSAVVLYLVVAFVALGVLGGPAVARSQAPILDAAQRFMGPFAMPVILTAATAAIVKSINAIYLTFSRSLLAMGRTGALPSAFARLHPRWGTPQVALIAVFLCCVAGLFLPPNLTFLFLAVNLPVLFKYFAVCLAAFRVVRHHPDLFQKARFRFGRTAMSAWTLGGAVCAVAVALLGFDADWRPYAGLGAWAAIGAVFHVLYRSRSS